MEGTEQTPASGGDPAAEGTPAEGTPTPGSGDQSEALRKLQSHRDSLAAENEKLRTQLAEASTPKTPAPAPTQPEALTAEGVMALLRREREMTGAVAQLQSDFSFADESIFTGYDKFESVEAFRAAAEASHNRIKSLVESKTQPAIEAAVEAALKPYVERYGRIAAPPVTPSETAPTGMPTLEEVKGYSLSQLDAFVEQYGEKALNDLIYSTTHTL